MLCASLAMWMLCGPRLAHAQSDAERAQGFYAQAISLYSKARYQEAIDAFDKAIEADPLPLYHCNKSTAQVKLGAFEDAVQSMTICRDTFEGSQEEIAKIDARLKGMSAVVSQVTLAARASAQDVVRAKRAPATVVAPLPVAQDTWGAQEYGLISMGIGGALLTGALVLDQLSAGEVDRFNSPDDEEEFDDAKQELQRRRSIFIGLAGAGTAFTLAGIGLFTYSSLSSDAPVALPSVSVSPQHVHMQWTLNF